MGEKPRGPGSGEPFWFLRVLYLVPWRPSDAALSSNPVCTADKFGESGRTLVLLAYDICVKSSRTVLWSKARRRHDATFPRSPTPPDGAWCPASRSTVCMDFLALWWTVKDSARRMVPPDIPCLTYGR